MICRVSHAWKTGFVTMPLLDNETPISTSYPRNSPTMPMTNATTPPTSIHIALSVGEPVKKREMSELNDVADMTPKITSRIPPIRSAIDTALVTVFHLWSSTGADQWIFDAH
jgi:hypothetical protein